MLEQNKQNITKLAPPEGLPFDFDHLLLALYVLSFFGSARESGSESLGNLRVPFASLPMPALSRVMRRGAKHREELILVQGQAFTRVRSQPMDLTWQAYVTQLDAATYTLKLYNTVSSLKFKCFTFNALHIFGPPTPAKPAESTIARTPIFEGDMPCKNAEELSRPSAVAFSSSVYVCFTPRYETLGLLIVINDENIISPLLQTQRLAKHNVNAWNH